MVGRTWRGVLLQAILSHVTFLHLSCTIHIHSTSWSWIRLFPSSVKALIINSRRDCEVAGLSVFLLHYPHCFLGDCFWWKKNDRISRINIDLLLPVILKMTDVLMASKASMFYVLDHTQLWSLLSSCSLIRFVNSPAFTWFTSYNTVFPNPVSTHMLVLIPATSSFSFSTKLTPFSFRKM